MRLLITSSTPFNNCETFIRDQFDILGKQNEVFVLHDGRLPLRQYEGEYILPFASRLMHGLVKGVSGNRNTYFANEAIKKYLVNNHVQGVIANYGLTGSHLAPICKDAGVPLIVIFHGHDATDKRIIRAYQPLYKTMFLIAVGIVAVSNDLKKVLIELGAPASKVHVISCGVDTTKFTPKEVNKTKLLLAVGRFVHKKGPLQTIQAFQMVLQKHPDARLVMVGPSDGLYQACQELAAKLNIQHAIQFTGKLSHDQVVKIMHTATVFVQHSMTAPNGDTEGTPVSILEAAASGLPVISTIHGGIKDAVINGKTGFLVAEGDISAMAARIVELLDNPVQAKASGDAGRQHIATQYEQVTQLDKLIQLLR